MKRFRILIVILSLLAVLPGASMATRSEATTDVVLNGGDRLDVSCTGEQLYAGWQSSTELSLYCAPHPTHIPTDTPTPTDTPVSTATLVPTDTPVPTSTMVPTNTPSPTSTSMPEPPTPQPTPAPSTAVWHGIVRSPQSAWLTMRDQLGASLVEFRVTPSTSDNDILAGLNQAQEMGLTVLLHIYEGSQNTNAPWYLVGDDWEITARGTEILQLIEGHPSLWAIYTLHEPFGSSGYHADADSQRALYTLLHSIADIPLYSDESSLARARQEGEILSDGMCDYCCTAPMNWNDGLSVIYQRIDGEYEAAQLMPNSQPVFMINTYGGAGHRLPTAAELTAVRDYMCTLGVPQVYYPWGGYTENLSAATYLWSVIVQGCNTQPPMPTPTPTPPPTTTPQPSPTPTPQPSGSIIIDHTAVDPSLISQAWLDQARQLAAFFNHRSIGNNILDGIQDLQSQNPARYTIAVQYSSGTAQGINHYQAGSNLDPISKVNGFASNAKDGHDAAFMKFCVGDFEPWTSVDAQDIWIAYRDTMIQQQANHPNTTLVWWTSPLTTQSDARGLASFSEFNQYVRAYVAQNGGVLFDIADIESHDPGGNPVTSDGYEAMYNGYSTDGAHLNETGRQRVAGAIWHLLTRIVE